MTINTATIKSMNELKDASTAELLECYNKITEEGVKKFRDRATAEKRTWAAIGRLAPGEDVNKPVKASKAIAPKMVIKNVKPKATKGSGKREDADNRIIQLLIDENPKRPKSRAFVKFALLMKADGKTVGKYKAEEGKHPSIDALEKGWAAHEIRWACKKGWVKLLPAAKEQRVA